MDGQIAQIILPDDVRGVLDALEAAGWEAWAVGGCVRDALLGRGCKDYDVASSCPAAQVAALFPRTVNTGERYGTVTVLTGERPVEVTTFRRDGAYTDGRRPDGVTPAGSVTDDLSRRDLTINAMAWHPRRGLCDPFGGERDLRGRLVRAAGTPEDRFGEDALRILRAYRFSSVLDFDIEPATLSAARALCGTLRRVSVERIAAELVRLLCGSRPEWAADIIRHGGLPGWGGAAREDGTASCRADPRRLRRAESEPAARLAGLLWLSGKDAGALKALRLDNRTVGAAGRLLAALERPLPRTAAELKREFRLLPPGEWPAALTLRAALLDEEGGLVAAMLPAAAEQAWNRFMLAVNGDDLLEAGVEPAAVREMLERLVEAVIEDPSRNDRDALLAMAAGM